jgi:predicted RNase H-like nuclease (RuvC/YqgF family)
MVTAISETPIIERLANDLATAHEVLDDLHHGRFVHAAWIQDAAEIVADALKTYEHAEQTAETARDADVERLETENAELADSIETLTAENQTLREIVALLREQVTLMAVAPKAVRKGAR